MDRPCHRYATIIEPVDGIDDDDDRGADHSSAVCGRRARRQHVYTSTSHVVHVRLESYRVNPDYFVLSYEGRLTSLESRRDQLSRSFFQVISHPSSSLYHLLPLHVIRLSCLGSERPHGLHVLSHACKKYCSFINYALNHYQVPPRNS